MAKAPVERKTLTQWRNLRGLSLQQIADALEISVSQTSDYMNGRKEPGVMRALKFAEVLKVKVEDVDWTGPERSRPLPPMPAGEAGQVTPEQVATAKVWVEQGATRAEVAKALGISRTSLYKYL